MARIRTIKPEFWTDEALSRCSLGARLLFIATWNFADDAGGLERSAHQLKAQAFPYDNLDCEALLQELLQSRLLIEYEAFGKKYLHIKGFLKHQRNERPAAPRFPVYNGGSVNTNGVTVTTDGATVPIDGGTVGSHGSSLEGMIKEGIIKEGMIRDGELAPCARSLPFDAGQPKTYGQGKPRGHLVPFPIDFVLTDTMREQALRRYPDCDVVQWFELFRAHHVAHGKAMRSWCAAWITWIGNGEHFGYPRRPGAPTGAAGRAAQADASQLQLLKDGRAELGLADFRDPYPVESADNYRSALSTEINHRGLPSQVSDRLRALVTTKRMSR